uniref:Exocyst complex component n=1 Tax=Steinernema glaseri TaxID=37863 RepID=A0A1I8ATR9_9BILA
MDGTSQASTTKDTAGGSSDTASTSYQAYPEMSAEQEFFLYELETTDSGSVGLVLRAIYDCGDVHKFSRALERRIAQYDKNILKVCTFHFQGYIDAIDQLVQLKERCSEIKQDVNEIDEDVHLKSERLHKLSSEVVRYRKLQKNVTTAIDQITMCLPVLDNYAKLQELMKNKKYYQALKVLEELDHTYFNHVDKYRFTQSLANSMKPIREEIRLKTFDEFKDFLANIRRVSERIGDRASKNIAKESLFGISDGEKQRRIAEEVEKNTPREDIRLSSDGSVSRDSTGPKLKRTSTGDDDDENLSAQDLIDFTPIHRCCQIFNVLGDRETFDNFYRKQRKEQAKVIIRWDGDKQTVKCLGSVAAYVSYLNEIIGFFVVEDHIMQTEPGLVTPEYKDSLWEMALKQAIAFMNNDFGSCTDVKTMLTMKKVIILFAMTMKSYGFTITPMYEQLQKFRDGYNEILMNEYCWQFNNDLEKDNYSPIVVNNQKEFQDVISQFPFYKRGMDMEEFPRKFPFSKFVPKVYSQAKVYLAGCFQFMEHLQLPQSEIEDTVRQYANKLLDRWARMLSDFVASKNRSLAQLIQITINIGYLEKSCETMEHFITKMTNRGDSVGAQSHLVTLKKDVFRDVRSEVEQHIDGALKRKVDDFMELASYDWEMSNAGGVASDYIADLIKFLTTTFTSFTNLPIQLARHSCMQTCKHLADKLGSLILSGDVKAISMGALEQFNLDVIQCEVFTDECPVAGFEDNTLSMTFATLRQLLDLVMESDWTTYLADYKQKKGKYVRVKVENAIILLEKMIEYEKKTNGFFGIGRGDRRKLLDTILRQLRLLQQGQ